MKQTYTILAITIVLFTACEHRSLDELVTTAESYEAKGDFKMANIVYDEIIKAYPEHEGAYINKAINLSSKQQYKEAIKVYKLGLKNIPESVFLHYNIAIVYNRLEQLDSAITYFTSALPYSKKCEPVSGAPQIKLVNTNENIIESSEILYERGRCYYELDKFDECIVDMRECINCGYMLASSHYMFGACLYSLGNEQEGCEEFYVAVSYGDEQAQEQIDLRCTK